MVKRMNLIDVIKGIMIVFVIITHFHFAYPDDYRRFGFFYYIDMAMPVFMIISGYLTTLSFERNRIDNIKKAWSVKYIVPKLLRFIIPFTIMYIIELPDLILIKGYSIGLVTQLFFDGGVGPGAYYTPVMIQLIFMAPVINWIIKKYDLRGVLYCFLFTAIYEAGSYCLGLPSDVYRMLAFRYVSLFSFGCFIAIGKKRINRYMLTLLFLIGIVWQTALNYIPLHPILMNQDWARVNYLSSLFVFPVMYLLIPKATNSNLTLHPLQDVGKASYNIFLVQMFFYSSRLSASVYDSVKSRTLQLMLCILFCTLVGYLFYIFENRLTSRIIKAIRKNNLAE